MMTAIIRRAAALMRPINILVIALLFTLATHSGASAQQQNMITVGSAQIEPDASTTIDIDLKVVGNPLQGLNLDLEYDSDVVEPTACGVPAGSPFEDGNFVCNLETVPGVVKIGWSTTSVGWTGEHPIQVTFQAVGSDGTTSPLALTVEFFGDEEEEFPVTTEDGEIEIRAGSNAVDITDVTINGPTSGSVNIDYSFTAQVAPDNATTPIVYTWSPAPKSGQGTATAVYNWSTGGIQSISLTVANNNSAGTASDSHTITIAGNTPDPTPDPGSRGDVYLPLVRRS